jgi:hypothetical protein
MRRLACALLLALLAAPAHGKVAIMTSYDHVGGAADIKKAGICLQALTPLLEAYKLDYTVFVSEYLGHTADVATAAICDSLDDEGYSVVVWVGGNQDNVSKAWWANVLQTGSTFTPDLPMIVYQPDFKLYFGVETGGTTFSTNSTDLFLGQGQEVAFPVFAAQQIHLNPAASYITSMDVLGAIPTDSTRAQAWRITGDEAPHDQGWTFIYSTLGTFRPHDPVTAFDVPEQWDAYLVIAAIAYYAPQEIQHPLYWGVHLDDELHNLDASNGYPYRDATTDLDWYDTVQLQRLADSLQTWGDMIVCMGVNPDSVSTSEGIAKRAIYNDPAVRPYFQIAWHSHGTEIQKETTVAAMSAATKAAFDSLRWAFPDYTINDVWLTGGQFGGNFYQTMTLDSLVAAMAPHGVEYLRTSLLSTSISPAPTATDPNLFDWIQHRYDGDLITFYPQTNQTATDTAAWGTGQFTVAARKNLEIFDGHHLQRTITINHVPVFSYGRGITPATPPGFVWLSNMRAMQNAINAIAGKEIVKFGRTWDVVRNYFPR